MISRTAVLLSALALCACSIGRPDLPAPRHTSSQSPPAMEREVFRQVNSYRRSRGLAELAHDPQLASEARAHSSSMAGRTRMSHAGFDRRFRRLQPAGFVGLAENVAMNFGHVNPAQVAVIGWRRSPSHHRNMISREHPYSGVGVARGRDGAMYFTQLFGTRK